MRPRRSPSCWSLPRRDTVQVYDFVAQRAFVGATKELMVDSLADEVGYVSVTRACPRRASAGGSRRHVGTSLS